MACTPQVISPCADDNVGAENLIGVNGDVSFDEEGSLALAEGITEVEIPFGFQKENKDYVFEYLYVKSTKETPTFIGVTPVTQTTKKFTAQFTGSPVTDDDVLFWRVRVPDGLHDCSSLQNSPKYAIVPAEQHGVTNWPSGQNYIEVEFDEAMPSADWGFEHRDIETLTVDPPQVFGEPTIVERSETGFKLQFGSFPVEEGYSLRWKVTDRSVLE